jgi:serine/threonine-protein kinase
MNVAITTHEIRGSTRKTNAVFVPPPGILPPNNILSLFLFNTNISLCHYMPSIIQGYEYDIFISYRHNDDLDGWVTDFVNNLGKELRRTIKETISIYFDTNPINGLLETHNVNKSLEGKLKCLIFIPIISHTYCDPRSFAWQHEFCCYNKLAKQDLFGRDIRLPGGNVASRILPVKINDLDAEDKLLLENEIDGMLRSIEFIYKESGVNRPLGPADNKNDNQNKTEYRNQVNKVANSIKDIIGGLQNYSASGLSPNKDISDISTNIPAASQSIAVLAFANMSGDPDQEFFSDGISEEIINMLAQVPGLKVAGRTSSFTFKGKNQDLRTIGEQLNVNHILEGSIRKSGNKIRITAQLINVTDGYHLWSEKYDRQMEDIFDIQDEISLSILNVIKIKLFGSTMDAVLKKHTDSPEAYQLWLKGRYYYNKSAGAESFIKAIDYFKEAIKIEPDYALAYAGIASSYVVLGLYNYLPPEDCLPQMRHAIQQCLNLDDKIAESHIAMGCMKMFYEWDFTASTTEFEKAIRLNSNNAEAHLHYSVYLGLIGNYPEAIKHASVASNLDPLSLYVNFNAAIVYWLAGDFEKVLEFGRRLVELEPNLYNGHSIVGRAFEGMKRYEEAIPEIEKAIEQSYSSFTLLPLALIFGLKGEKAKVREVFKKISALESTEPVSNSGTGFIYLALGESDKAFQYFERAIEKQEGRLLYLKTMVTRYFPEFENDPRTIQILERIGLPYQ